MAGEKGQHGFYQVRPSRVYVRAGFGGAVAELFVHGLGRADNRAFRLRAVLCCIRFGGQKNRAPLGSDVHAEIIQAFRRNVAGVRNSVVRAGYGAELPRKRARKRGVHLFQIFRAGNNAVACYTFNASCRLHSKNIRGSAQ